MSLAVALHARAGAFRFWLWRIGLVLLHLLVNVREEGLAQPWLDWNPAVEVIHLGESEVVLGVPWNHPALVPGEDERPVFQDENCVVEAAAGGIFLVADASQTSQHERLP